MIILKIKDWLRREEAIKNNLIPVEYLEWNVRKIDQSLYEFKQYLDDYVNESHKSKGLAESQRPA
jgi:hypothetical protein